MVADAAGVAATCRYDSRRKALLDTSPTGASHKARPNVRRGALAGFLTGVGYGAGSQLEYHRGSLTGWYPNRLAVGSGASRPPRARRIRMVYR